MSWYKHSQHPSAQSLFSDPSLVQEVMCPAALDFDTENQWWWTLNIPQEQAGFTYININEELLEIGRIQVGSGLPACC